MKYVLAYALALVLVLSISSAAIAAGSDAGQNANNGGDSERVLSKVTFIHWKQNMPAKPPWAGEGRKGNGSSCYAFISNGAKWKFSEPYAVNPANGDGLNESFVMGANEAGMAAWEAQAGDVFGSAYVNYSAYYNDDYVDGVNSVSFGSYPNSGVIAVTTVWGYFYGPPKSREIIEFDLLYNDPFFAWGNADGDPLVMDLQNIATHELGHAFGLSDLYTTMCIEETMYGYSTEGETKKRTLEAGDIAGITKLYG